MAAGKHAAIRALLMAVSFTFTGCDVLHQLTTPSAVSIQNFQASPSQITVGAQSVLSWDVSGADSVQIDNGIGAVPPKGSRTVTPQWTTTYVLAARAGALNTQSSIELRVVPPSTTPPTPGPTPGAPVPSPSPQPTPKPTPTPTPTPTPSNTPVVGGPVAKAAVGVIFVVCDNQGLPDSQDASSILVGCKVHLIVNLKDAHGVQVDNRGPINWAGASPRFSTSTFVSRRKSGAARNTAISSKFVEYSFTGTS